MIKEQIQKKIIESMKSGDKIRVKVLRFVISEIKYAEINKKFDLTDEETVALLRREVKKRNEAIEMFKKGNRSDLVEDEEKQVEIIKEYMPKNITEDELKILIKKTLVDIPDKSNPGKLIGIVMAKVKGQTDGSIVARLINEMLAESR
jgi:uncharacterized protein